MPPVIVNALGYRISVARVINGRFEDLLPGQVAESLVQFCPAVYATRYWGGVNAGAQVGDPLAFEKVDRESLRRPSAGVQAIELLGLGLPIDDEECAAHTTH